jgi:hypothetical protein
MQNETDKSPLLLPRIRQIVEIHPLAVAVDPGSDQAEAIEAGAGFAMAVAEVERNGLAVEFDSESPAVIGIVNERPVVRFAVGQDVRTVEGVRMALAVAPFAARRCGPSILSPHF